MASNVSLQCVSQRTTIEHLPDATILMLHFLCRSNDWHWNRAGSATNAIQQCKKRMLDGPNLLQIPTQKRQFSHNTLAHLSLPCTYLNLHSHQLHLVVD